jgi:hypothetical protein
MKTLAIETYALKPHLETTGEILLDGLSSGQSGFCFIGDDLTWKEYPEDDGIRKFFFNMRSRINRFEKKLASQGITVLSQPILEKKTAMEIEKWALSFAGDVNSLKNFCYKRHALGLGVASSLISKYKDPDIDIKKLNFEVKYALIAAAVVYERALELIKLYMPDVILTFNGRFACCYPIVSAANEVGVKIKLHERGCDFRNYEVFESCVHSFEMLRERVVRHWDNASDKTSAGRQGEDFFKRRREGDGLGWKSFTTHQTIGEVIPGIGKRRIVYFSSSDDEFAATEGEMVQKFEPVGQKAAVQRLINICREINDSELIIRVHPRVADCSVAELAWWLDLANQGVVVVPPLAKIDSYALAETAAVVCTYGSTMGVEAAYWGTPSILLGDSGYSGFGCCFEPESDVELKFLLLNIPNHWDRIGCVKFGYYMVTFGKKFIFYKPTSLFDGTFLGDELSNKNTLGLYISKIYRKISYMFK